MDSLPRELLMRVQDYAAPTPPPPPAMRAPRDINWYTARHSQGQAHGETSGGYNTSVGMFWWVSRLRLVNRHWKNALDDPKAMIWYYTAKEMGLEPPLQLYSGGTYRDVAQLLLQLEYQKMEAQKKAIYGPQIYARTGCIMVGVLGTEAHPKPERPVVTLPKELVERVTANANALESFLNCIDIAIQMNHAPESKATVSPHNGGTFKTKPKLASNKKGTTAWHVSTVHRYKMFLYLKQKYPDSWLVPTADIEFAWLCHIFRTSSYWKDMKELRISPSHSLCLSNGEAAMFSTAVEATQNLWNNTFGPDFPYLEPGTDTSWEIWRVEEQGWFGELKAFRRDPRRFFPSMGPQVSAAPTAVTLPTIQLTADQVKADLVWFPELKKAFREMKSNSFDVLRGRGGYGDELYSQQLLPSYERFLNLCNQQGGDGYAPPYVLDLIWHAHQMEPHLYKQDCITLFGREFWHDPWPHGLGVSTALSQEFECAWKEAYGTPIGEDWKYHMG